ncbi:hypothetical protein JET49_09090, partial [Escherichia coli]
MQHQAVLFIQQYTVLQVCQPAGERDACMRELEGSGAWGLDHVDVERLNRLAADALTMEYTQKHWKPEERIEVA